MAKLYIVGTPIGNFDDITLRALKTLEKVEHIACEDTRVTTKLLRHFELPDKKLFSYNNFNERSSSNGIIKLLEQGIDVALVSDAGMPVVSDPGFEAIKQVRSNNFEIEIIPGVNAAITAFVGSNFSSTFTFLGFLKDKSNQRKNELAKLEIGTYIFYVSPHKLEQSLLDINEVFSGKEQICLSRELTKMYETWYYGNAKEVLEKLLANNEIKGEFTLILNIPKIKKEKVSKYAHLKNQ
ncbi:16S rRNA (cytidine(1402)-2'-O)-methyltransferase [Mycoplasmopsis gallinacea]|uniref:Ribosomal RNA small subunit methyltransferase I n=1 Tax=Mycoplasmopsis gallinacea TaxID=29556 RepID=A0A6H0V4M8_9BACT|nr:16S rRNA (cytidine(1402)-2'-O)-methyltransferase [Mycoplasmopsis gallinacea]QIW61977.1 16S rRNA (cytidine(1402)-2'-O)-methyltransferase [Mycoplasmopsis gallinacea]